MPKPPTPTITVAQLKRELATCPDDWEISFGGCLTFYRLKKRGDTYVDLEFNESVYRDDEGVLHIIDTEN